ncbi:MAG: PKD domain-containing protein, partial [Flavobacteriales bacterium]
GWGGAVNNLNYFNMNNNAGYTNNMDITSDAFQSSTDGSDFYLMVLEDDASNIVYGSYLGGDQSPEHVDGGTSRFDNKGKIYQSVCAGCVGNSDMPIKPNPGAVSPTNNSSNCNNAVFKMDFKLPSVVADFRAPTMLCTSDTVEFENNSKGGKEILWNFGDGDTSRIREPEHVYDTAGTYDVTLIVTDTASCNIADTLTKSIIALSLQDTFRIEDKYVCNDGAVQIGIPPLNDTNVTFSWSPTTNLSDPTVPNPIARPDESTTYNLEVTNGVCDQVIKQDINISNTEVEELKDSICIDTAKTLQASSNGSAQDFTWSYSPDFFDTIPPYNNDSTVLIKPDTSKYAYIIVNNRNCTDTDSVFLQHKPPKLQIKAQPRDSCPSFNIEFNSQTNNIDDLIWEFSNSDTSTHPKPIRNYDEPGKYIVKLSGKSECNNRIEKKDTIHVHKPPELIPPEDTLICGRDNVTLTASSQGSADQFHWSTFPDFSDTLNPNMNDSSALINAEINDYVHIRAINEGCEKKDSVFVSRIENVVYTSQDTGVCPGDTIQISAFTTPNFPNVKFQWNPDQNIIGSDTLDTISVSTDTNTQIILNSRIDNSCSFPDTIDIDVSNVNPDLKTLHGCKGESIVLGPQTNDTSLNYTWSPSAGLNDPTIQNPVAAVDSNMEYS